MRCVRELQEMETAGEVIETLLVLKCHPFYMSTSGSSEVGHCVGVGGWGGVCLVWVGVTKLFSLVL